MSVSPSVLRPRLGATTAFRMLVLCLIAAGSVPLGMVDRTSAAAPEHLVISEVMTGGASANDELIELYNPSAAQLPLEGLELVYVTASGATVSRRASWDLGAPALAAGSHLLVANEAGVFAAIADVVYASGIAASGGSVAIRIQGAGTAIDAVGWGTATGPWPEGMPATAPPSGSSLERLPGGTAGSTVDTNDNARDFTLRPVPDPQNSGSPPVPEHTQSSPTPSWAPTGAPTPTPVATPTPIATPTSLPSSTPGPSSSPGAQPVPIATARALAEGARVTIQGEALTGSDFGDGGGYVADASAGIAVLVNDGSFARGDRILVSGTLDDRFSQRTIRADGEDVIPGTSGEAPDPITVPTGSVGESVEGLPVRVSGVIHGSPATLTGGLAFEVDDGSGPVRVFIGSATGIDTTGWEDGAGVTVVGVAGQRDSSGTGASGYRIQPRDDQDVDLGAGPTPGPSAGPSSGPEPTATASPPGAAVISIAAARAAGKNTKVTVRGVVTLGSGTIDAGSAVIQDASGAILLRLGDEAGAVRRGELLEVAAARSTKGGMESLRVTTAPRRLGTAVDPSPRSLRTGHAGEESEARLVIVRGSIAASARRASSGTVSFEIDDGSGPLRVVLGAGLAADDDAFVAGAWVEATGVLGQETTGAQPLRGYRVWPRGTHEVRTLAGSIDPSVATDDASAAGADGGGGTAEASLDAVDTASLADLRVGATLVAAGWTELGVAGLLWDGSRLVGIAPASRPHVERVLEGRAAPLAIELRGMRQLPKQLKPGIPLVQLSEASQETAIAAGRPAPPSASMPAPGDPPAWISVVGRLTATRRHTIEVEGSPIAVERLCRRDEALPAGTVNLIGIGLAEPARIIVGCDGARVAPALDLSASAPVGRSRRSAPLAFAERRAAAAPDRRLVAAALLGVGVAILILGVAVARRHGQEPEESEPDEAVRDEGGATAGSLTLVRVPNERGP